MQLLTVRTQNYSQACVLINAVAADTDDFRARIKALTGGSAGNAYDAVTGVCQLPSSQIEVQSYC